MFRGLLLQELSNALKSRLLYLYILALLASIGILFMINSATIQFSSTPNLQLNGIGALTGLPSLGSILIFLSIFGASRRIPEMINPTLAGFYISKPISRIRLLSYTLLSTTIVYSALIFILLGIYGIFLTQLFPTLATPTEILQQSLLEVFVFIVYIPILSFLGLSTRSGSFAFLLTFAVWLVAKVLALEEMRGFLMLIDNAIFTQVADFIFYMLPRSSDISALLSSSKSLFPEEVPWSALWTSSLSAAGAYILATLKFRKMDF